MFKFKKSLTVKFHMRGGHVVVAKNVVKVEMTRNTDTGAYIGYKVTWHEGKEPEFFSLSIPDIVAVTAA